MSKFSITISADTLDELYASVAAYIDRPVIVSGSLPSAVFKVDGYDTDVSHPVVATSPIPSVAEASAGDDDQPADDAPTHDKGGIVWDQRIHSSSRALNEDGTWRKRRGVSDVLYASVMAELSEQSAGAVPTASPVPPTPDHVDGPAIPAAPTTPLVPTPPLAPAAAAAPAIPSAPAIPAAPVAPTATAPEPVAASSDDGGMEFSDMMPKISAAIHAGKFTNADLTGWCEQWGLSSVMQLAADRVKTKQFDTWLTEAGLI